MSKTPRIFLDTNIALDLIQNRQPYSLDALQLFALAEAGRLKLLLSTDSISTIFYVVEKNNNALKAREAIAKLLDYVELCSLNEPIVLHAMMLDFVDVEDALINSVAENAGADMILTRNIKDFKNATVPVRTPPEFLASLHVVRPSW